MNPTWYDLLGVEPTASSEEIRAAWRAAIADLDPTDRRFGRLAEAAAVLLDDDRRREYDASLEPEDGLDTPSPSGSAYSTSEPPADDEPAPAGRLADEADSAGRVASASERIETEDDHPAGRVTDDADSAGRVASAGERIETHDDAAVTPAPSRRRPPGVVTLTLLTLAAVLLVGLAAWAWSRPDPGAIEDDARDAQAAAETAVAEVLSYDYRTLDDDERAATSLLTPRYRRAAYDDVWRTITRNAPQTQTVVTARVVASSIVRAGEDRAEVLVLVDRPTSNKKVTEPVVYEDHVTVTMVRSGDEWLIDDLRT